MNNISYFLAVALLAIIISAHSFLPIIFSPSPSDRCALSEPPINKSRRVARQFGRFPHLRDQFVSYCGCVSGLMVMLTKPHVSNLHHRFSFLAEIPLTRLGTSLCSCFPQWCVMPK